MTPRLSPGRSIATGGITLHGTGSSPGISPAQTVTLEGVVGGLSSNFKIAGTLDLTSPAKGGSAGFEPTSGLTVTVLKGGRITTSGPAAHPCELGENDVTIVNKGTIDAGAAITYLLGSVSVINDGTISVGAGDTLGSSAGYPSFTNAATGTVSNKGKIVLTDPTFVARGRETGNAITLVGGTLNDDTAALAGSFIATGGITLHGTGSSPGISPAQTVTLEGVVGGLSSNFKIAGTLNLTSPAKGGSAGFEPTSGLTVTVLKGGRITTSGPAAHPCELGENDVTIVNKGTIDAGAAITYLLGSVSVINDGTISVGAGDTLGSKFEAFTLTQPKTGVLAVTNDVTHKRHSAITGGSYALGGRLEVTTIGTPTKVYSPISSAIAIKGHFRSVTFHGASYKVAYAPSAVRLKPATR